MGCALYIRCALSIYQKECRKRLGCVLYIDARYLPENTVILKSLHVFRTLRYSSRDGHAEELHGNRGTDTPSVCSTLQLLDMSTLGDISSTLQTFLAHA
jgi:hypothetical protein